MVLLFEFLIGPMISGRTIWGTPFRLAKTRRESTLSVLVSPDEPAADLDGVQVDFGHNLVAEAELSLTSGTEYPEGEPYSGIDYYDFELDGQSEFSTLVDITIPNTAAADEVVQVAYYNKALEAWENLPFESDGSEIRFATTHFSRFGLIKYHKDRYRGPLTPLVVNYTQLRKALAGIEDDGLFEQFVELKGKTGSDPLVNKGLSIFNDSVGAVSAPLTMYTIFETGDLAARELSDRLMKVGGAVTVLKVVYQWAEEDPPSKILQDNIFDICELILGGASLAIPGSWILPAAGVIVFATGFWYEHAYVPSLQDDSLQYAQKAYSTFCNFPYIAYSAEQAKALAEGTSEDSPWVVNETYNSKANKWEFTRSGAALQRLELGTAKKWQDALMDIYKLYQRDPRAMQERVEALIEEYLDTFWYLDGLQQQQFAKDFCAITDEQWRWPTESEINQLKEAMRYELMQELKPVFAEVQRTILEEMKKGLQKETDDLVLYLNQEISFEVRDPDAEEPGLRNSRVADDFIRFETVANAARRDDWISQPDKRMGETVFAATLYNYLHEGAPAKASFFKTEKDLDAGKPYMTVDLDVQMPVTTIVLGQEEGIPGTYVTGTSSSIGVFPNEWALRLCLEKQFPEITVDNAGKISASAPALSTSFTGTSGMSEPTEVTALLSAAQLSGEIDLQTGQGSLRVSGSMEAQARLGSSQTTWTATYSGDLSVAYVNGSLILASTPGSAAVHLTGLDVTRDEGGEITADFDTDVDLNERFTYKKVG